MSQVSSRPDQADLSGPSGPSGPSEAPCPPRPSAAPARDLSLLAPGLKTPEKGFLLAFEGLDGSGKSTQARLTADALEGLGLPVSRFREPTDGGAWGVKIRSLKSRPEPSEELGMFLKDRAWDVLVNILPALDSGRIVVMDRYILSSVSCQGAAGLPPCEILKKNLGFPWPDLTVILDVSPAEGLARIRKGRPGGAAPAFENPVYLEKVRETLGMAKSLPGVELVDGRISRERLAGMLLALAEPAARLKIRRPAP